MAKKKQDPPELSVTIAGLNGDVVVRCVATGGVNLMVRNSAKLEALAEVALTHDQAQALSDILMRAAEEDDDDDV